MTSERERAAEFIDGDEPVFTGTRREVWIDELTVEFAAIRKETAAQCAELVRRELLHPEMCEIKMKDYGRDCECGLDYVLEQIAAIGEGDEQGAV